MNIEKPRKASEAVELLREGSWDLHLKAPYFSHAVPSGLQWALSGMATQGNVSEHLRWRSFLNSKEGTGLGS